MPIFPTDSNEDKYTGPESISPKHQALLDSILENNLNYDEKMIVSCRRQGDAWSDIAIRIGIPKRTVHRMYKRACLKIKVLIRVMQEP